MTMMMMILYFQVCTQENVELVYVTYHVDVGETPFFIGIDYDMSKIVISIRGTLSMKVQRFSNLIAGYHGLISGHHHFPLF